QDHAVAAVMSGHARRFAFLPVFDGGNQPAAMLGLAQKSRETRVGIEARHAQPVDRAVAADQSRGMAIPDDGIIFDPHAVHAPAAARSASQMTSPCGRSRPAGSAGSPSRARAIASRLAAPDTRNRTSRLDSSAG